MVVYECEYMVDSRDIDPWYHCRPSGLMGMLQEAATQAACALHVSRDEMLERYNSFWMLARLWYRLDVPLSWGDTVHIRTWHRGGRGASTYRDFDLFVNGQPVGEAVSTWVLADAATHKLARMGRITEFQGTDGGPLCKERTRKSLEIRLAKLNDQSRKDDTVTFEQLGIDRLFIDESHYFKNCAKRCA